MSEKELYEWTYWDQQANAVACSVEKEAGNPYRARVLEGSDYQLALEILHLAAHVSELEKELAEAMVHGGHLSEIVLQFDQISPVLQEAIAFFMLQEAISFFSSQVIRKVENKDA